MNPAKVAIISIGNELLLGKTINTNLSYLAAELASLGLPVNYGIVIPDENEAILDGLRTLWPKYGLLITTGGLGPTGDDITKGAIAQFFGKPLVFDEGIWRQVCALFEHRGMQVPAINRNQALIPQGFNALDNTRGTAPGLSYIEGGKTFVALPGVPEEMDYIFQTHVKKMLTEGYHCKPVHHTTIHTWDTSESALAERLADVQINREVSLAWLPQTGRVDLRLSGTDKDLIDQTVKSIVSCISDVVWGMDDDSPASVLQDSLVNRQRSIAIAESCTGGLLQQMLTAVPGASQCFKGGMVTYSNELKNSVLGVSHEILNTYGAVSEETARVMAGRVRQMTRSDYSIAITGIAGPEGGSESKPVGTVWFAFASSGVTTSVKRVFNGDRHAIRHKAAEYALIYLWKMMGSK